MHTRPHRNAARSRAAVPRRIALALAPHLQIGACVGVRGDTLVRRGRTGERSGGLRDDRLTIAAQKGTAGSCVLLVTMGHELGGQKKVLAFMPGQQA